MPSSRLDEPPRSTLLALLARMTRCRAGRHARELHARTHLRHSALADHLEHATHLRKLLEQPIHFLDGRAAPARDPLPTAPVDHRVIASLVGRHRADDRFYASHLLFIGLVVCQLLQIAESRNHPEYALERAHSLDGLELRAEVIERELVFSQLLFELLRLIFVDRLFGLLDER